ncbi:hypothetical protein BDN70DRAFT_872756 [Pholiota conissans]|uniref:ZZ-type domain-containing protein n=1 Tax=Pholiota conissans TaxID=109636 RepID=A0A9P5ZCP1_9AGAR|nr:hypothetical protein BDN70DRAFT_872756 [Pholiota conissans]
MALSKDSDSLYSPRERDIQREYKQWAKAHQRIKNGPAQEGRDYVRHAKNLLPILEGFAELHPIAKAVVTCFKAVVMYEDDRKENDARVAVLFLSQSDLMGTLLDVNQLSQRRRSRQEEEEEEERLHSDSTLSEILLRVEREIKACGNSMDTYYKETRFVKFWKSQEWKDRILGHATKFNEFRILIQQTLSIQVASDVGTVLEKMNVLLFRLYSPKADWEKEIVAKTRQLGKPKDSKDSKDLISDSNSLQTLVAITKDPLLDSTLEDEKANKPGFQSALPSHIEQLRKELHLSLDVLCERNQEMFELKLNYHTQQLQEAILNSAQYVVQSLSGPYDRLRDVDLKILWKEMNWIFCVDNKLFTSALFEYYLDHFSTVRQKPKATPAEGASEDVQHLSAEDEAELTQENLTKVTFLSRLGVLNHVDAWTLEAIAMYGHRISSAIDRDDSGFIRISEANIFTDRMPKGWSLPQWCAYAALGEAYESRVYRKRIHNILGAMMEMQAKVLPLNRGFVTISTAPHIIPFFQLMAWEPTSTDDDTEAEPPTELRLLVHEKIKKQDDLWRQKLRSFNWNIEDEATLQLLYGKNELETYVLQLGVLLLEYAYSVMQACCVVTVDVKEMSHLLSPLRFLQRICMNRISALQAQFQKEKKPSDYLDTFSGGMWRAVNYSFFAHDDNDDGDKLDKANSSDIPVPFQLDDVYDFITDELVLEEFPLPLLVEGQLPYLEYKTWEEHVESLSEDDVPEEIPNSWDGDDAQEGEEDQEHYGSRYNWTEFPLTYRNCNRCAKFPIKENYYVCSVCTDFDLCSECYQLPVEDHTVKDHNFSHAMLRFSLHTVPIQREWLVLEANSTIRQMQEDIRNMWEGIITVGVSEAFDPDRDDADEIEPADANEINIASPYACNVCEETIQLDSATTFYKCLKHSCGDYSLCERCAHEETENEDPDGHQWWHSLAVLRRDILVGHEEDPSDEESEESEAKKEGDDTNTVIISAIGDRISEVEAKLDATNSMIQEALTSILQDKVKETVDDEAPQEQGLEMRMSQLEEKVDGMVEELRSFMESFANRSNDDQY